MNIAGVTRGEGSIDYQDLARGMCREMAHAATGHFYCVLETWFAVGLQFMAFRNGF